MDHRVPGERAEAVGDLEVKPLHIYRVRKSATNINGHAGLSSYAITIPREIGEKIHGRLFHFRLTDEGLVYTPVEGEESDLVLPEWAKQ